MECLGTRPGGPEEGLREEDQDRGGGTDCGAEPPCLRDQEKKDRAGQPGEYKEATPTSTQKTPPTLPLRAWEKGHIGAVGANRAIIAKRGGAPKLWGVGG